MKLEYRGYSIETDQDEDGELNMFIMDQSGNTEYSQIVGDNSEAKTIGMDCINFIVDGDN